MASESDERWSSELRAGSREAFERIYAAEKSRVYGFLVRLTGDVHVAADLFQNVWLKLARHCRALRPDTNLRAWLLTVARNEFVSYRRAQALDLSRLLTLDLEQAEAPGVEPAPQLSELAVALRRLCDSDREVLLLTSVDCLPPDQVGEMLGISPAALRQRLSRARKRLACALEEIAREAQALGPERARRAGG